MHTREPDVLSDGHAEGHLRVREAELEDVSIVCDFDLFGEQKTDVALVVFLQVLKHAAFSWHEEVCPRLLRRSIIWEEDLAHQHPDHEQKSAEQDDLRDGHAFILSTGLGETQFL